VDGRRIVAVVAVILASLFSILASYYELVDGSFESSFLWAEIGAILVMFPLIEIMIVVVAKEMCGEEFMK
jgi:hypothetical protein